MEVLSLNEIGSTGDEQQSGIITKIDNESNIILICFDSNNEFNNDTEDFKIRLHQINRPVVFHTELESCINFIKSIEQEKIFLIISGSSASQIVPHITLFDQIDSIFILSPKNNHHEHLPLEDSKIVGIYDKLDLLFISINEQIDFIEKRLHRWCFFDQVEYATKDLSKQANGFLWLQLFHSVLLHLPCDQPVKRQKIDTCRPYYQPNDAIPWFMKHSSLRNKINKALQLEDIDQLYIFRHFLSDLIQNLRYEHQKFKRENLVVYRRMKLSRDEFNQIQENKDKLISMKGFLIASTERLLPTKQTNFISVLFEIECNLKELDENFIFADVTQLACQETILFDLNSTFRVDHIKQDEQFWIVKLNAVNVGQSITQKYIHDTRRQIEDLSIPIIFGKLICDMCQWNQSQKYFQHLLNNPHDEDLAWIEHSIGQAHHWKGEWNEARKYYVLSYERMMHTEPVRIKDSAVVLSNIGEILYLQGKYEEAFDCHQRVLIILKKYYSSNHIHIATSLVNIGRILQIRLKDDEAFVFFQQALSIRVKYYNYLHVDIATSLSSIAYNLTRRKKYDEALAYHQRAMSIYKQYYPSGHVRIAVTLDSISDIFYRQGKYDESLDMAQQALTMQKKFYPSGHIDVAGSLIDIGNIKYDQENYDESLELHHQALTMLTKYYSSNHIAIVSLLNNIGGTELYGKQNCDKALRFHQQALAILETYYPSYLAHIAITLNNIGDVFSEKEKNDEALDLYHRALKMQEEYYLSDHIEIVSVLRNIGNTLEDDEVVKRHEQALTAQKKNVGAPGNVNMTRSLQGIGNILERQKKYDEALDFYQRSLTIIEEFDPFNYGCIAHNLSNISRILFRQEKYEEAFDFEQRALDIRKTHNSTDNVSIIQSFNQMGHIRFRQMRYDEAYNLFQEALAIYEKYPLSHRVDVVSSILRISRIKIHERKYDEALTYCHRAISILEEFHPTDYTRITYGLECIGFIWSQKQSYDRAIEYYEKCLRISESSLSPGHVIIADDLSNLGEVQRNQHQYEHSLAYELKCFLIREKVLPPDHQDIGKSLASIGECYQHLNQYKMALDYYKRALIVYEQCLPFGHPDRSNIVLKVQQLSAEIKQINI
jgi:tetratricopeptide (TPR) repeat protein